MEEGTDFVLEVGFVVDANFEVEGRGIKVDLVEEDGL